MDLGVCYYPEQWPQDRWVVDAAQMAGLGLTHVRIGEFAWAAYEPQRDRFEWDWLDESLATLHDAGLRVILGTPTATPPIWLAIERPEILAVAEDGRRRPYGTRRHTCPTSAAYRAESARIVEALVDRYGDHPGVVGWQLDNEPGNHDSARCWCEQCQLAFSAWLAERYGTIAALNDAWGTIFWSQVYPDFAAVALPRQAPTAHSPSLLLAHMRFASNQVIEGLRTQAEIVRRASPGRDIAVNFYAGDTFIDYRAAARIGGIGAIDSYPHGASSPEEVRFWHDLARGISGTNRGWIMEQQPGAINWTPTNPPVPDGQVAQWLSAAAADGIELAMLFRWRAALAGQEQYHTGMLRHDGSPDRAYGEVAEAKSLGEVVAEPATTAVVYDYEDAWAFDIEPHQDGLTHRQLVVNAHAAARARGPVDVVGWDDDWSRYELVVVPAAILAGEDKAARVIGAAGGGATVVVGPRAFTRNEESVAVAAAVPIALDTGSTVIEGLSIPEPLQIAETDVEVGPWFDSLRRGSGQPIGRVAGQKHLQGMPVATAVGSGRGRIVMMGASSREAWSWLLHELIEISVI